MERKLTTELGRRLDGTLICRYRFINDDDTNYMVKAHSYFTKEQRKLAKLNHKANT